MHFVKVTSLFFHSKIVSKKLAVQKLACEKSEISAHILFLNLLKGSSVNSDQLSFSPEFTRYDIGFSKGCNIVFFLSEVVFVNL